MYKIYVFIYVYHGKNCNQLKISFNFFSECSGVSGLSLSAGHSLNSHANSSRPAVYI